MGGPMNVEDYARYPFLLNELNLIENVLKEGKPVLGICLGAQLIAKALGGRVYPNQYKEVGWYPVSLTEEGMKDPLFAGVPSHFDVLHWHGDTFDLPDGAIHLARSQRCEVQAFRWGYSTYAIQFHLEVTPQMVREWCSCEEGRRDVECAGEDIGDLLRRSPTVYRRLEPIAKNVFSSYFQIAYTGLQSVR
jgi:GMP synthase (glutamine-hydrolysing)